MPPKMKSTFQPRARLMLLLGDELIKDAGIAVFELVKNAYDADASLCKVTLHDIHLNTDSAHIVIEDNGHGMSPGIVESVWLSPGTRNRLTQRERNDGTERSPRYDRLPLGEKGLGRFAVHKLGSTVEMITRTINGPEVVVEIDWNDFDNDSPLSSIPVSIHQRAPQIFKGNRHGTKIVVSNLRDLPWTRRRGRSLHRAITSICSPTAGPGSFTASVELKPDPNDWFKGLLTPQQAMDLALFRMAGTIGSRGVVYDYEFAPTTEMDKVDARRVHMKQVEFPKLPDIDGININPDDDERIIDLDSHDIGDIEFEFSIFDRDRQTLALMPGDSKTLTEFLNNNGGVKVYREGVRVYDFGEPGNDWLDLGGRRVNVPAKRIGNNQIIGSIRLKLNKSRDLVEKTNREGFVENQAYVMLRRAVQFAMRQAEVERNIDKERIRKAYSKAKRREPVLDELRSLENEIDELKLEKEVNQNLKRHINKIDVQYREMIDRLLVAAGAGLNLAIVLHEVEKHIKSLYRAVARGEVGDVLLGRAKSLSDMVDTLTWITRQSGKKQVSARDLIENCIFLWQFRFERHGIVITNGLELEDPQFQVKANRRLILTALMNLVDNAIYWVTTRTNNRKIYIGTTCEVSGRPALVVADNGPGFQDASEYVTEAFFTRKPDGMGLGLHLTEEIMKAQGGKIVFPGEGDITLPDEFSGAVVMLEFDKAL